MKHDDYLLSFLATPEFSADEAAALWCGIDPYSQQAEHFYESAFRSLYDPARRTIMLATASDKKKQYYSIYAHIHGAMATTNDSPQRKDKISRQALIDIANALKERPAFLFPDGSWNESHPFHVDEPQTVTRGQAPTAKEQKHSDADKRQRILIEKVRELMKKEIDSNAWPSEKRGKEGLLKSIWRKHRHAIKTIYGEVEYDTIRRKTSPVECKRLGLSPLPK